MKPFLIFIIFSFLHSIHLLAAPFLPLCFFLFTVLSMSVLFEELNSFGYIQNLYLPQFKDNCFAKFKHNEHSGSMYLIIIDGAGTQIYGRLSKKRYSHLYHSLHNYVFFIWYGNVIKLALTFTLIAVSIHIIHSVDKKRSNLHK